MIRLILVVFFVVSLFSKGYSQSDLSEYSFVVVPDSFEFLNQRDEYQLNSLTKHLFNRNGFHAFLNTELPDVRRCDGLWADVEGSPGFVYTRIVVILKDCNGNEVYRSIEGTSKIKAYNRTYQDALRKAFRSITALNVQQKEIRLYGEEKESKDVQIQDIPIKAKPISEITSPKAEPDLPKINIVLPKEKFSSYNREGSTYLLRKTASGYSLYQETNVTAEGLKLVGEIEINTANIRFKTPDGAMYKAAFDATENLYIYINTEPEIYTKTL